MAVFIALAFAAGVAVGFAAAIGSHLWLTDHIATKEF